VLVYKRNKLLKRENRAHAPFVIFQAPNFTLQSFRSSTSIMPLYLIF